MIWIVTDTVAWVVYVIIYLPVVLITALCCLGRRPGRKQGPR